MEGDASDMVTRAPEEGTDRGPGIKPNNTPGT
jgi:hypothetical protein